MLKKLQLIAVMVVVLSMLTPAVFSQIDMSGRVRIYFDDSSATSSDESKSNSTKTEVDAAGSIFYQQPAFADWIAYARFGTEINDESIIEYDDIYAGLSNGYFGVRFGYMEYLDPVADMGGWETAGIDLSQSLVNQGQLSKRTYSSVLSIDTHSHIAIKLGAGIKNNVKTSAPDTNGDTTKITEKTSNRGMSIRYNNYGLVLGVSLYAQANDEISPDEATINKNNVRMAIGASYDFSAMQVPLNIWYSSYVDATQIDDDKGEGFNVVAIGGKYSFTGGDIGLSYENSEFRKLEYIPKDKTFKKYQEPDESQIMIVTWVNYNLSNRTKVFGSLGSYTKKFEKEEADDADPSNIKETSIRVGLRQNF
ncbi:MAG: porin [SAR324 cluster bacterium]|nr:porin [SAR324 cluster bacterium]